MTTKQKNITEPTLVCKKRIEKEYNDNKLPTSWRVWPHSTSKGWMDRIEKNIPYE